MKYTVTAHVHCFENPCVYREGDFTNKQDVKKAVNKWIRSYWVDVVTVRNNKTGEVITHNKPKCYMTKHYMFHYTERC